MDAANKKNFSNPTDRREGEQAQGRDNILFDAAQRWLRLNFSAYSTHPDLAFSLWQEMSLALRSEGERAVLSHDSIGENVRPTSSRFGTKEPLAGEQAAPGLREAAWERLYATEGNWLDDHKESILAWLDGELGRAALTALPGPPAPSVMVARPSKTSEEPFDSATRAPKSHAEILAEAMNRIAPAAPAPVKDAPRRERQKGAK